MVHAGVGGITESDVNLAAAFAFLLTITAPFDGVLGFLLLLLFVISLRIVINAVMVILIPGIIIGLGLLLTTILPEAISYSIAGLVGLVLVIGASYMFAYISAFKTTVWTLTYLELIKHKDLDVIMDTETI
mgnify:CR=1 FL=1